MEIRQDNQLYVQYTDIVQRKCLFQFVLVLLVPVTSKGIVGTVVLYNRSSQGNTSVVVLYLFYFLESIFLCCLNLIYVFIVLVKFGRLLRNSCSLYDIFSKYKYLVSEFKESE